MQQIRFSAAARSLAAVLVIAQYTLAPSARGAYADDIHFTELRAELGGSAPTGAGVFVSQVEAPVTVDGQSVWMVDTGNAEFAGKTLTDMSNGPPGLYSGHATAVGQQFYGTFSSIAPGIPDIAVYSTSSWTSVFLGLGQKRVPYSAPRRIANHSWIGNGYSTSGDVLRRQDWLVENDDFIQVAAQDATPLLANAFNVIAAGRSDGAHSTGSVAIDTVYVAGRTRPDVVIPAASISEATPRVSAVAALLVQSGHATAALSTDPVVTSYTNRAGLLIRNAERAEVIKAALMAGADRVTRNSTSTDLALYRSAGYQTANGLDSRYGAGQVNILNSYRIIAAGEQNSAEDGGPGSGAASAGFDYDPAFGGLDGTNSTATYELPASATPRVLTAALVWHLNVEYVTIQDTFIANTYAYDLALSVIDVTDPGNPVTVFTSQSTVDNTENAWLVVPAYAQYQLRVTRASGAAFDYDYGIAWQLLYDTDADGAYDDQDNCIYVANGPIVPDSGGNSQRDTDGDGYGNFCDADLNNSGHVTTADYQILRNNLSTADPDSDLDGSGLVTTTDYTLLRLRLNLPPGPSAFGP